VFTWLVLELLGVDLEVTMGVIVGFLDLVPLIIGALLAIPTAATIGVLIDEWLLYRREVGGGAKPGEAPVAQPEPAAD